VGCGRYLHAVGAVWADWDPQKKQFVRAPALPPHALPWCGPRQAETLLALIQQTGTDPERFCDHYQIDTPEHLPAVKFAEAEAKLKTKRPGNGSAKATA
jgi:hypothetical protein